jgi:CBS domain-containing protein
MTCEVIDAFEDQGVTEAARLMEEHQIHRLVVLNRDKQSVGIVSLGDLAVYTGNQRLAGEVAERVSEPAQPQR